MHNKATLGYFCAPPGHFWTWHSEFRSAMGAVLGNFLGSRDTLVDLLEALAPEGLPPLGAVVLVNAAAQTVWDGVIIHTELQHACDVWKSGDPLPSTLASLWMHTARGLDAISKLPNDLKNGAAKRVLVRTIFEGAFNRLPADLSREILDEFKSTPSLEPFMQRAPDINGQARLLRDLSALAKAFDRLAPSQLENRLRTGIDGELSDQMQLPLEELAKEPHAIEVPDDLLSALEEEGGQLAQVAGVARRLSAILHVPKPVWQQDDLPVGGVSDITNRGEPDRLLLTELAWDELTFATRLAQGEALYTRRESPPSDPPPKRKILLDTGIHLWGKPRLFALGTVLALLRSSNKPHASKPQESDVQSYSLMEEKFEPTFLSSVGDVRAQLARLEPTPYPAQALAEFVRQETHRLEAGQEVFLVTHPSAMEWLVRHQAWQQLAASCLLHSIQVDRWGTLRMSRHSVAGTRLLMEARVDLDALLQGRSEDRPAKALTSELGRLPAFYKHVPWPLYQLVYSGVQTGYAIPNAGYLAVTPERSVCYVKMGERCGKVLWPTAPKPIAARAMLIDGGEPGDVALVFEESGHCKILCCNVHDKHKSMVCEVPFMEAQIAGICFQSGALVVYHSKGCDAFSPHSGQLLKNYRGSLARQRWFDGSSFSQDLRPVPLSEPLTHFQLPSTQLPPALTQLTEVGFLKHGGLCFKQGNYSSYHFVTNSDRTPCWHWGIEEGATLLPLMPFRVDGHPDAGLTHAEFQDGRRIIYDPKGFLHVQDAVSNQELSILVHKGNTTAWCKTAGYFGDRAFLWGERIGEAKAFAGLCARLFRPMPDASRQIPIGQSMSTVVPV
jgi:hypothetical protein